MGVFFVVPRAPTSAEVQAPPKKESKLTAKNITITSLAGGVSGALEILFTYPFEFAKTQQQLEPKKYSGKPFWVCWKDSYREFGGFPKGITGIYRGMPPLILFGVPRNAFRFTGFEVANQYLVDNHPELGNITINIMAGFVGGFSEAVTITTVQETMKVRLIHDRLSPNPRFRNTFHGVSTILKEQGASGIYKGLGATKGNLQGMAVGGLAGAASVLGNTPIDVIKTKMQGFESHRYKSTMHCITTTMQEEGLRGFYKGMGARMGRVSADVALTFFFVEKVKVMVKAFLN